MKIEVFCIFDSAAQAYLPPFNLPTTEMAVRTFGDTVNDPTHPFSKHPQDYALFEIGTFDDSKGIITPRSTKVPLGTGTDYLRPQINIPAEVEL